MKNLPEDFVRETRRVMGEERYNRFVAAFDEEAPTSIRLNPGKLKGRKAEPAEGDARVAWCDEGYYLKGRPAFTFDPLFHAGCYYVQEAASMFVGHALRSIPELPTFQSALDLCAAPGGKSTAMRTVLPEDCTLVSNEPMATRAQILLENITKWGWKNCMVTNCYPRDYRKAKVKFDMILCDVPCSGEGMFRKDAQAIGEWSLQNVEKCWRLQREIVEDAWAALAPGGYLIYSTCTFNTKENEENVVWMKEMLGAELLEVPTEQEWHITGSLLEGFEGPVYRFIPGITRGEGLFMALLRKPGEHTPTPLKKLPLATLTADLPQGEMPTVMLTYQQALTYLRGEALTLDGAPPRGLVGVGYQGIVLGPVKNIGSRANNLYPKPWRIKTTHLPQKAIKILNIE